MTEPQIDRIPAPLAADIPPEIELRRQIAQLARAWVATQELPGELDLPALRGVADGLLAELGGCACYRDYCCVLLNNEIWREQVARVPFAKRLLLLPKCMRHEEACEAPFDRLGLICQGCQRCAIHPLQRHAEELGYAVLVAEGSAVALEIIRQRGIEAIIGVSCLSVLERAFEHMRLAGMPGLAIPLLSDSCRNSQVDLETVWDVIHLRDDERSNARIDFDVLRARMASLFTMGGLERLLGASSGAGEEAAREQLCAGGKRWRPLLCAATALTVAGDDGGRLDPQLEALSLAVECFHKASLIHDDIEDDDRERDGRPCLHARIGEAAAINGGDLLLGAGYQLLATSDHPALPAMLRLATDCHLRLGRGQGWELDWRRQRRLPPAAGIIEMFRQKTAPAFAFGIGLGALQAGCDEGLLAVIKRYADELGIAYQIRDDRQDIAEGQAGGDLRRGRPSLALSLLHERCTDSERAAIDSWLWDDGPIGAWLPLLETHAIAQELGLREVAHRQAAREAVLAIADLPLRNLLLRLVARIFDDLCLDAWTCSSLG